MMIKKLLGFLIPALLAISTFISPSLSTSALAFDDPIQVCSWTVSGTSTTHLIFPDTTFCNVASLLGSGYDTLQIKVLGTCHSASVTSHEMYLNFNGDFGSNYGWAYYNIPFGATTTPTDSKIDVGPMACEFSLNNPNASSGFQIEVPKASSTTFNKEVTFMTATDEYIFSSSESESYPTNGGGSWYRSSIGAVNRFDLTLEGGDAFENGTIVTVYKR